MPPTDSSSKNPAEKKMLSARTAARRLQCHPDYVTKLCREGKLSGERTNDQWLVSEDSLKEYETKRDLARRVRSESLADLRRKENVFHRKVAPSPLKKFIYSAQFATSVFALFTLLVVGSTLSSPYFSGERVTEADAQGAALAYVESPFFGTRPAVLDITTNFGIAIGDIFSRLATFLFGGEPDVAAVPVQPEPVPVVQPLVAVAPATTTIVTNSYPVVERVVERVATGNWVSTDLLIIILGEFKKELTRIIGQSVGGSVEKISSGGLALSDLTDANIPDTLTVSGYLPLTGGTLTGALTGTTATFDSATTSALSVGGIASTTSLILSSAGGSGTRCLQVSSTGVVSANASACGGVGGGPPRARQQGGGDSATVIAPG